MRSFGYASEETLVKHTLALLGDINLMQVSDASVPFRRVREVLAQADCRFANLECCLYDQPTQHELRDEGFFASPAAGEALKLVGIDAIGNANNVNYGADVANPCILAPTVPAVPTKRIFRIAPEKNHSSARCMPPRQDSRRQELFTSSPRLPAI
jgi:hypothetical protein